MPKAHLEIHKREGGEPGYFLTGNYPLIRGFCCVEDNPQTDFSVTAELLKKYLDVNFPKDAPHNLTFHPEDRSRWTQFQVIEVSWKHRSQ